VGLERVSNSNDTLKAHTVRSNSVVLGLVILGTAVGGDEEMFLTERVFAVLAFEWQKVDEETGWMRALFADRKELFVSFRRGGSHRGM
jgi:hypothetical protein